MDVHQLELFLAVMDSSSMPRAAKKIHLSPGVVSLQLRNLASELNTELFVRSGKRLAPIPAALRLALALGQTDYPRKLTQFIAESLRAQLVGE